MIGVPINEPNTPPCSVSLRTRHASKNRTLLIVNVPPAMSSIVNSLLRACAVVQPISSRLGPMQNKTFLPRVAMAFSIPTRLRDSAFRTTGVTRPFSVATATLIST